jgi:hypothetical protein
MASTLQQLSQFSSLSGVTPDSPLEGYAPSAACDPQLGYLWSPSGGPSLSKPLSFYYNKAGQIAGLRVDVFGEGAAQGKMIDNGYYTPAGDNHWYLSVSFRPAEAMCTDDESSEPIGDRLVINQDSIAESIPMTAAGAKAAGFMPGSCMTSMGQHWFYDLAAAPSNSFISGNLLPIVPMYHMEGALEGTLNAFFFTTPICQGPNQDGTDTPHTWDNVKPLGCGLTPSMMCENFCDDRCSTAMVFGAHNSWESSGTSHWATFHIFFNADPKNQPTCPGYSTVKNLGNPAAIPFGRTCPANTATPNTNLYFQESRDEGSSNDAAAALLVVLLVGGGIAGIAAVLVWHKKKKRIQDIVEVQPVLASTGSCYGSQQVELAESNML